MAQHNLAIFTTLVAGFVTMEKQLVLISTHFYVT